MSTRVHRLTGVFIGSRAIAEGVLTRNEIRRLGYRRLVQGVYADPALPWTHQLRCRGAALLLPRGAVIGGYSAAAWYGAPFAAASDPVTVLRPADVLWRGPRGIRVHRTELTVGDWQMVDDVPITTALRTAWDVATLESLGTAVAALDAMVRAESVSQSALVDLADRATGRWGAAKVRRAVPLVDPRADSPTESRVRVALVLAGLAPQPQFEVEHEGRFVAKVDFGWPDAKLAVEYDGAHHLETKQVELDNARLARLRAAGWQVIRLTAQDLRDLDRVVQLVREALAARLTRR
jgi:very-short-patch-repair endonuclease